jgi:hypothetical protein
MHLSSNAQRFHPDLPGVVLREMIERTLWRITACAGALAIVCLLSAAFTSTAAAQDTQTHKLPSINPDKAPGDNPEPTFSTLEEELAAKRVIRAAEKEYQENLDRARELSVLGTSLAASFKEKNLLDRDNLKKLEKVEKLAKGIRSAAGGSEDDGEMEKPPKDLCSAMATLGNLSKSLKEKVEKTPKHVISAAVIDEANVLLQLIRIIRTLPPQA